MGFREELPTKQLAELVEAQDERLLAALHRIEVSAGGTVLMPGGQPHAIGEGVFVLELQEPTDLSVMLEHRRFGLEEAHAFLGLTVPRALESVDRGPQSVVRRMKARTARGATTAVIATDQITVVRTG